MYTCKVGDYYSGKNPFLTTNWATNNGMREPRKRFTLNHTQETGCNRKEQGRYDCKTNLNQLVVHSLRCKRKKLKWFWWWNQNELRAVNSDFIAQWRNGIEVWTGGSFSNQEIQNRVKVWWIGVSVLWSGSSSVTSRWSTLLTIISWRHSTAKSLHTVITISYIVKAEWRGCEPCIGNKPAVGERETKPWFKAWICYYFWQIIKIRKTKRPTIELSKKSKTYINTL